MPEIYGIEHILYLLVSVIIGVTALILQSKYLTTDKQIKYFIKGIAFVLLICICWNRYAIAKEANNYKLLLPDSFCGTSSMVLALSVLIGKKDNDFLHCVCYIGFIGGMLTMFYPDFIGQADTIFFDKTMSGLLHHTIMVFLIISMVKTKYFVPTIKRWKCAICGGAFYIVYGLFLNKALDFGNPMDINNPILEGTILHWYVMGAIFIVVYFTGMFIYESIRKHKASKNVSEIK